jgi:hypothetical protein
MNCPKCHNKLLRVHVSYNNKIYMTLYCHTCILCSHTNNDIESAWEAFKNKAYMQSGEWKILNYIDTPKLSGLAKFVKFQNKLQEEITSC